LKISYHLTGEGENRQESSGEGRARTGILKAKPRVWATMIPWRVPVKEPGPVPTIISLKSLGMRFLINDKRFFVRSRGGVMVTWTSGGPGVRRRRKAIGPLVSRMRVGIATFQDTTDCGIWKEMVA
jgi:hypothetical protein